MIYKPQWKLELFWKGGDHVVEGDGLRGHPSLRWESRFDFSGSPTRTLDGRFSVDLLPGKELPGQLLAAIHDRRAPIRGNLVYQSSTEGSWSGILTGHLASMERVDRMWRLHFVHGYPAAERPLCRRLSEVMDAGDLGGNPWLPQVFGTMKTRLIPLFHTDVARLSEPLPIGEDELHLATTIDWPGTGHLQVQDEVIGYTRDGENPHLLHLGSRTSPREHPRGAVVARISAIPLRWCVADHPALLLAAHLDDPLDGTVVTGTTIVEDAGGRDWTLLERDSLPLRMRPARTLADDRLGDGFPAWNESGESNVQLFSQAFPSGVATAGALLQHGNTRLEAVYTQDQGTGSRRFDRVERLFLEFYFTETGYWEQGGQLEVLVAKGSRVKTLLVNEGGRREYHPVAGQADIPDKNASVYNKWHVHHPDTIGVEGPWDVHSALVDDMLVEGLAVDHGSECALSVAFSAVPATAPDDAVELVMRVRVQNRSAGGALDVKLKYKAGTVLSEEDEYTVPAETMATLVLPIVPTSPVDADVYMGSEAEMMVELPDGGDVVVGRPVLEVLAPAHPAPLGVEEASLAVVGLANSPISFNHGLLDVTDLLEEGENMAFLGPEGGAPLIRFTMMGSSGGSGWTIRLRDIQWRVIHRPALSVEPYSRLVGLVEGRGAENDGSANPVDVVGELLLDPLLGALDAGELDASSFETARGRLDDRGIRHGAVLQGPMTVGRALGTCLGESLLSLWWRDGKWRCRVHEADPAEEPGADLPARDVWEPGFSTLIVPPAIRHGDQILHRGDGLEIAPVVIVGLSRLEPLLWLLEGVSFLARALEARSHPLRHTASGPVAPTRLPTLEPGVLLLPDSPLAPWKALGEIASLAHGEGMFEEGHDAVRLYINLDTEGEIFGRWLLDGSAVLRVGDIHHGTLDGAGNLHLAGSVNIGGDAPPVGVTVGGDGSLALRAPGEGGAWMIFGADGNLAVSHTMVENSDHATVMEAPGYRVGDDDLALGGVAGGVAALVLEAGSIRLRGEVWTT